MRDLGEFDERFKKVEFKYTLAPEDTGRLRTLLDHKKTQARTVSFWDTPDLALWQRKLVLRQRLTDDEPDSTVKLRPAEPADVSALWRDVVAFELDVVGVEPVGSAKLDFEPQDAALFSTEQRSFVATCAGAAFETFALQRFGPVPARKRELKDFEDFPFELSVEAWTLQAGEFIELSCKVKRAEAKSCAQEFKALLRRLKVEQTPQLSKTEMVLTQFGASPMAA